jgi:hypothetical protein
VTKRLPPRRFDRVHVPLPLTLPSALCSTRKQAEGERAHADALGANSSRLGACAPGLTPFAMT